MDNTEESFVILYHNNNNNNNKWSVPEHYLCFKRSLLVEFLTDRRTRLLSAGLSVKGTLRNFIPEVLSSIRAQCESLGHIR
jgi:hypothetical protein